MEKKKCFITGVCGFIGGHLYDYLKNKNEVWGIDNLFHSTRSDIPFQYGDIRFKYDLENHIKNCDVVFHCAAQIHVDKSIQNPQETIDINVGGTLNILDLVRKYNKEMIFASSSEVYGSYKEKISEKNLLNPQSPYGASKAGADRLCKAYFDTYGIKAAILRNFNCFGIYQNETSYGGVIAIFTRQAFQNKPLYIFGLGEQERDYIYFTDAVKGYEFCLEKKLWGRPINIGTGRTIKINDLAKKIIKLTGSKSKIVHLKPRAGEVQKLCADTTYAKSLGFKIETDFDKNLSDYIKWYYKNNL